MNGDSQPAPQIALDPMLAQEQEQAQGDLIKGLQTEAAGDTASIMARYGTQLAGAGAVGGSPLAAPTGK